MGKNVIHMHDGRKLQKIDAAVNDTDDSITKTEPTT